MCPKFDILLQKWPAPEQTESFAPRTVLNSNCLYTGTITAIALRFSRMDKTASNSSLDCSDRNNCLIRHNTDKLNYRRSPHLMPPVMLCHTKVLTLSESGSNRLSTDSRQTLDQHSPDYFRARENKYRYLPYHRSHQPLKQRVSLLREFPHRTV